MADTQFPQFQESQPVLNVQQVNSKAEGQEAFEKFLGQASETAEKKAEEIETDQSKSMYINSVANIEQLKTSSKMRMLEHPDQALRISDDMESAIGQVKEMAYVNKQDRTRLNAFASGATDEIALKAVATNVNQSNLSAVVTHYVNFPNKLQAYKDAIISGNEKLADNLQEAMITELNGLVVAGALTPEQAATNIRMIHETLKIGPDFVKMYNHGEATAVDYHTLMAHPLNNNIDNTNAPINEHTNWLIDHYNQDKTFQGVIASISNNMLPNPEAFGNLTDAQRQHAILSMQGMQRAQGLINSGESFPTLEKVHQELSTPGRDLSYRDRATRDGLEQYISELRNGNYLAVIGKTPSGGRIMQSFVNRNSAIQNAAIDDSQKAVQMAQNRNDMVNAAVSYGHAHHIPDDLIKPIPPTDLANMQNGFILNQDPIAVLKTLGQYNKQNQAYIAGSLKTPEQRLIAQTISYAGNGVKPEDQIDLIAANQTGRTYGNIKPDASDLNDSKLRTRIGAKLRDQLSLMNQQYDFMDAQTFQGAMINSTLNLAKYLASKNNDLTMNDADKWIDQATGIYQNSFPSISSTNYMVNPKQLPQPLTKNDLDYLANYAITEGYQYIKGEANLSTVGMLSNGNINLHNRPSVKNADGSISTVRSISITDDKNNAILIPTVSDDGKIMSNQDAIKQYKLTGKHLGIFNNEKNANSYAMALHNQQAEEYTKNNNVFDSMQSRNPLKMRISSTNNLEAVDQNGRVYFSEPFTSNTLAVAKHSVEKKQREAQEAAITEFRSSLQGQFHVD